MNTSESIEKDAITKVEGELLNAMKNCDTKKLDELLHEGLLFNIPNGQTITKAMDIESYSSGSMKINKIRPAELKISLIGDNAIVSVVIDMKGMYFDYSLDGRYKIIRIWKSLNDKWKVIGGSSIKLDENNS